MLKDSSLGRKQPPAGKPGLPGAAAHTRLLVVLRGLRPSSLLAAPAALRGPGGRN